MSVVGKWLMLLVLSLGGGGGVGGGLARAVPYASRPSQSEARMGGLAHRGKTSVIQVRLPQPDPRDITWKLQLDNIQQTSDHQCQSKSVPAPPKVTGIRQISTFEYRVTWRPPPVSSSDPESRVDYFTLHLVDDNLGGLPTYLKSHSSFDVLASEAMVGEEHASLVIANLRRGMTYTLFVTAHNRFGHSDPSNKHTFISQTYGTTLGEHVTDSAIIVMFIAGWLLLVYVFFRKWGAIKNLQPRENRYKNEAATEAAAAKEPEVKIVEKEKDSLITYKESRSSKIAKFKKMRDFRLSRLKTSSFFSTSAATNERRGSNLSDISLPQRAASELAL